MIKTVSYALIAFFHTDAQDDRIMWGTLIFYLTWFISTHYHVKCRCSKLLHYDYVVIIGIRLLSFHYQF